MSTGLEHGYARTHVGTWEWTRVCVCTSWVLAVSVYTCVQLTPGVSKPVLTWARDGSARVCPAAAHQARVQPHRLLRPWESVCALGRGDQPSVLEEEVPRGLAAA